MFFGGILIAIDLFTFQTASASSFHSTYIPTTPSDLLMAEIVNKRRSNCRYLRQNRSDVSFDSSNLCTLNDIERSGYY